MELNSQSVGQSAYLSVSSYSTGTLKRSKSSDYFFTSADILHNSRNFILILSPDGRLKNMSTSLFNVLGYSEDELLAGPVNNLLSQGQFILDNHASPYYINSVIPCKGKVDKAIRWRLVPDLLINAFVFVGWETSKK